MSWDEHIMLIAHGAKVWIEGEGDREHGSNSTREAVHATQQGLAGRGPSLQINPYYGKTSTKGLLEHFEAVMISDRRSCTTCRREQSRHRPETMVRLATKISRRESMRRERQNQAVHR